MKGSTIIRIVFIFFGFILIVFPVALQAGGIDSSMQEIESGEMFEAPKQMTQKELNDLFGEDPYLGQTSYLQSPDGFSQREKLK
tara:strand:- start:427 stop:678 length:252 start_codon:yes stop_codon:yes gene_type:complete